MTVGHDIPHLYYPAKKHNCLQGKNTIPILLLGVLILYNSEP